MWGKHESSKRRAHTALVTGDKVPEKSHAQQRCDKLYGTGFRRGASYSAEAVLRFPYNA